MWLGFSALFENGVAVKITSLKKKSNNQLEKKASSSTSAQEGGFSIGCIEKIYLIGIIVVELWGQFLHSLVLGDKFPFVPLMLISIYCAIGVIYSWIWQLKCIIRSVSS